MVPDPDFAGAATIDDSALMQRVRTSDEAAFAELMGRWEVPVKAVIARMVLNSAEAEDLAQETFVRLWEHRSRFEEGRPVKPWILGIALNLARGRLRWWKRRPLVALEDWTDVPGTDDPSAGAEGLARAERAAEVQAAVASLPADYREALVLFEYENLSYAEIASIVGASTKTVENRIARAREKLRGKLKSLAQ